MKGNLETASLCGWKTAVYIPEGGKEKIPLLYILGGKNIKEELADLRVLWEKTESEKAFPFLLAGLGASDWNSAYSPWPAPPLTREGEEFAGRASETGRFLIEEYLPYVCERFPASERRENRAVVGYSLGGLGTLYLFLETGEFAGAASCSGSLWYPGWCKYMEKASLPKEPGYVYLSLGRAEKRIRSRLMGCNPECTERTSALLSQRMAMGSQVVFQWNNGGHGYEVTARILRAISWLQPFLAGKI